MNTLERSPRLPVVTDLTNADALEAFMEFPTPLALMDLAGRLELTNVRFLDCIGVDTLDWVALDELTKTPDGVWRETTLSQLARAGRWTKVRTVRTSHQILLIVEQQGQADGSEDLEKLRERINGLERLATIDPLTGAWNRAHLDRVIDSELARSLASRQPLSLIFFDIDHFKKINDTFGHWTGDTVLRELVTLLRSRIRTSDLLFRWGGEEFAVLVSSAGHRRAEFIAENLRKIVAGHAFTDAGTITVSIGVAEHDASEDARAWFHRLDEALYAAKHSGRNRVVVAPGGNSDAWAAEGGRPALHLDWHEAYQCGDPTIDAEHQELFQRANRLIDVALRAEEAPGAVKACLGELLEHVQRHFADEEAILERYHYAALDSHKRAHAGLMRRALQMTATLEAGQPILGAIVEFIAQDFIARHMMVVDKAFFPLFRKPLSGPATS